MDAGNNYGSAMSNNDKAEKSRTGQSPPVEASGEGFVMLMGSVEKALEKGKTSLVALHEKSRAAAAPAVAKAKITLSFGARRGQSGVSSFYSGQLKPGARKAADFLRSRLNPAVLTRDYRKLILPFHRFGGDRNIERLFFVPTAGKVPLTLVKVPHQLRRTGHDYRPAPWHVFQWAMQTIPESVERFAFVDYGAGRGRALLMAAGYPFEKVIGAEIAEELHRDCLLNIAQYPRSLMKCRDVECEHLSALRLDIPEQETVFFFNNPFDNSMTERVIAQIARAYRQEPRRFYVICVDMDAKETLEDSGIFEPVRIPFKLRAKLALLSPYSVSVHRTVR